MATFSPLLFPSEFSLRLHSILTPSVNQDRNGDKGSVTYIPVPMDLTPSESQQLAADRVQIITTPEKHITNKQVHNTKHSLSAEDTLLPL